MRISAHLRPFSSPIFSTSGIRLALLPRHEGYDHAAKTLLQDATEEVRHVSPSRRLGDRRAVPRLDVSPSRLVSIRRGPLGQGGLYGQL